jgi:hypothetical protein
MGHICVVMRATHDMRPQAACLTCLTWSMFSLFRMFFTLGNSLSFLSVKNILNKENIHFPVNDACLSSLNYKNCNFGR